MPAKHYIIPIDAQNRAYLGRKSMTNPYTNTPYTWGRGAPNIFGGNLQVDADTTLYMETREESHYKVDLNQLNLAAKVQVHQAYDNHGNLMTFYAIRGNFTYNAAPYFPALLAGQPKYRETTGDILMIDLGSLTYDNAGAAGGQITGAFTAAFGPPGPLVQMNDFLTSEGMTALCYAAFMVQWGQI
jgi:hypothetical protein